MGKFSDVIDGLKPVIMMVIAQIGFAGANVFYKIASNDGMNLQVLIAYRFMFSAAMVVPLAMLVERNNRPKLTWKIAFHAFFTSLFGGSMAQNLYAVSLVLTSSTFVAAIINLCPAITYILAIIFRMEGLDLKTKAGKAKVMGTLICITGAMVLTFYKGHQVNMWSTHVDLLSHHHQGGGHVATAHHHHHSMILGPLLAIVCCLSMSISLIMQAKLSEIYPCHYSSTALMSVMGSFQATCIALCVERDYKQWRLGWSIRLLTAAYMGVVASGIVWILNMMCVRMRGPLYVSVFSPLLLVLVALSASLFLNENLHLGSILGSVIIISGLYSVLWGKRRETKKCEQSDQSKTTEPDGDTQV